MTFKKSPGSLSKDPVKHPTPHDENALAGVIDDHALWTELAPTIKRAVELGGGAQQILSKSQAVAATKLVELLMYSKKDDVKFKAAKELLDRSLGKSVERKISIHGDLTDMSERELDGEIKRLLAESGDGGQVLDAIIDQKAKQSTAVEDAVPAELKKNKKD